MPSIYDLKPKFQQFLQPIARQCGARSITPNQITITAIVLSFMGGVLLVFAKIEPILFLIIPVLLFLRMVLNALDGMLAREHDLSTPLGEVLNELGDIVSDLFLYGPLFLTLPSGIWAQVSLFVFLVLGILSEFCGVLAKSIIKDRRYDGPMGKSDRAFLVGFFCLTLYFWPNISIYSPFVWMGASILLLISCMNRLYPVIQRK